MISNPIKYASRTFQSIMNDINSDSGLVDKPSWFKRLIAGIGDVISMWINSMINLLFLRTSYTRESVTDLCQLIDYDMSTQTTSQGKCLFYARTDLGFGVMPFSVIRANLASRSIGSLLVSAKKFEASAGITFPAQSATVTANAGTDQLTWSVFSMPDAYKYTGHKFRISSTGTLPSPLQTNTDYYCIYTSGDSFKVAASLNDAFAGNFIDLTTAGTGFLTVFYYSYPVDMSQQEKITAPVTIGESDGVTEWQEFDLPDELVLKSTVTITINSLAWTLVTTFVDSTSVDRHFKIVQLSNNRLRVRFGNGTLGMIPPAFPVIADYYVGGGKDSNVSALNAVTNYCGSDSNIVGVTNPTTFTGGNEAEAISSAKINGPILLKSRSKFVEVEDGEALAMQYGGLALVKIWPNYYGPLTCRMFGIAIGGGNPSPTLRSSIASYLQSLSLMDSIYVAFDAATFVSVNVQALIKLKTGYNWTGGVYEYALLATKLFLSENGTEIKNEYVNSGIESAVTMINNFFGTSFTESSYTQIAKLLDGLTPANFGDTIQESNVLGYIDSFVDGVDYVTVVTFGSGFPLVLTAEQITTPGTITLQQIL